jgi:hypothetical protein
MYRRQLNEFCSVAVWMVTSVAIVGGQAVAQQSGSIRNEEIEILTRGPVHEAFAETVVFDPEPGLIIRTFPPK